MRYALFAVVAIVVVVAMFAARVQAYAPDWLIPPGGTLPPEPQPAGDSDASVTVVQRIYAPYMANDAVLAPARCDSGCNGVHMAFLPMAGRQ